MKKLFCLLLVLTMAIPAFADKINFGVTGHAPTVTGTGSDELNREIASAFDTVLDELNNQFNEIAFDSPGKLLRGFGNSSVYASHGATTRGYAGYKIFSATIGPTFGVQLPTSIFKIMDEMDNLTDSLEKEGDINLGINPNLFNVNVGLNLGVFKFIPEHIGIAKRDNFYIGLRVGYFNLPDFSDELSFKTFTLGLTVNYQILPSLSLAGLVKWRGVSLGSGFLYNSSKVGLTMPLGDPIREEIGSGEGYVYMDPKVSLNLDINTFTIPLEVVTAIKLLIFNIPIGIGADIAFGKTSLGFGVKSDIELEDLSYGYTQVSKGDISVSAGASNTPQVFNFKIMTGFGLSMGPVVLDIPITYYPGIGGASGYNFGITMGAVF